MITLWNIVTGKIAAILMWVLIPICGALYIQNQWLKISVEQCNQDYEACEQKVHSLESIPKQSIGEFRFMERQTNGLQKYYKDIPKRSIDEEHPATDDQLNIVFGLSGVRKDNNNKKDVYTNGKDSSP